MNTSKVSRIEVIDHTKSFEQGGGRVYVFWNNAGDNEEDIRNPKVELLLQDDDRTLKIFISNP